LLFHVERGVVKQPAPAHRKRVEELSVDHKLNGLQTSQQYLGPDETALLEILKYRYARFCEHFGRDPELEDPLFFDTKIGAPVPPNAEEARLQVIAAAAAANVDYRPVLRLMGLN
jgi:hypothetical protein